MNKIKDNSRSIFYFLLAVVAFGSTIFAQVHFKSRISTNSEQKVRFSNSRGETPSSKSSEISEEALRKITFGDVDPDNLGICPTNELITQSTDNTTITAGNSVSCNGGAPGFFHADNSYWRAFDLGAEGITRLFMVTSIDIGIEASAPAGADQPITVNLYSMTAGTFPTGTRTLIGTATINIGTLTNTVLNIPVTGTANPAQELVVEVFTPDGIAAGNNIFIGSNTAGQSGPSYISAAACSITDPTDLAAIGFPTMHVLMNVNGCELIPTAASVPISGRVLTPGGRAIRNASITITKPTGETQTIRSNAFGYYRFEGIQAGDVYVFNLSHKQYGFDQRIVNLDDELTGLDFIALE